jgi:hypothetical protein
MWFAYCYAESVEEVELLITNMARWTSPSGASFLPVCDTAALGLDAIPFKSRVGEFGGEMRITSLAWTWIDPASGKTHRNLIAPHEEHLVEAFSRHFRRVAIVRYPSVVLEPDSELPWIWQRKAILATEKRKSGDGSPSQVVDIPAPHSPDVASGQRDKAPVDRAARPLWRRAASRTRRLLLRGLQAAESWLGG